jgi:hypothetical protein
MTEGSTNFNRLTLGGGMVYPIPGNQPPPSVLREMLNNGTINRAQYDKFIKGKDGSSGNVTPQKSCQKSCSDPATLQNGCAARLTMKSSSLFLTGDFHCAR